MSAQTAAVFAATGDQGSAVVQSLLKAGYKVTGFTRDTSSPKSQELEKQGVEVVKADLNDPESYKAALQDKDAVFVNADFWSIYLNNGYNGEAAKEAEIKQAKDAIQTAVDVGVKHVVYSTLDGGRDVIHWDSKAEVSQWTRDNKLPVTNLYLTFYFSGIPKMNLLKPNDDGSFTLSLPAPDHTVVPGVAVEQTGDWVLTALQNPDKYIGKDIYGINDALTIKEMAEVLSKISGKTVKTNSIPDEYFLSKEFENQVGHELWTNWKLFYDGYPKRDVPESKSLIKDAYSFESWAKQNNGLKKILGF